MQASPAVPPSRRARARSNALRTIVIDDDEPTCELLEILLEREGMEVSSYTDADSALAAMSEIAPHVVLTDLEMEGRGGIDVVKDVNRRLPDVPVIVVTGHADLEHAVGALRAGAYDFLSKPLDGKVLIPAIRRAAEHQRLKAEVRRLRTEAEQSTRFRSIVGRSTVMKRALELVDRVARTDASVLVSGESGTGKELIARAIHDRSERTGPFVAVNCAAMPSNLIESELFGHAKGAFTDAHSTRKGLFVEAEGGTLFLDEIGELPPETQPKLLRALQERKVRAVGSDREVPFDARIVTATNRVLQDEVKEGRFREDLYYRINVVSVQLPPLRDRGTDVLALAQVFLERIAERYGKSVRGIRPETAKRLLAYPWPGNVRELENCIDRAVALTAYEHLTVEDLPPNVSEHRSERVDVHTDDPETLVSLAEIEARYIQRVLNVVEGNKSQAARVLQIDRRTLYRKIERLEANA